jgi:hypothetical protein
MKMDVTLVVDASQSKQRMGLMDVEHGVVASSLPWSVTVGAQRVAYSPTELVTRSPDQRGEPIGISSSDVAFDAWPSGCLRLQIELWSRPIDQYGESMGPGVHDSEECGDHDNGTFHVDK